MLKFIIGTAGTGKSRYICDRIVHLAQQGEKCLFLIPALFIMSHFFELDGIFYAQPVSDVLATTISVVWVCVALKRLGKDDNDKRVDSNEKED